MSIIVLYITFISLTIIKCNVLTCFDNKITGAFRPKVGHYDFAVGALRLRGWGHCDFAIGALRLGLGHSGRGAFKQWGIATIIPSTRTHCLMSSLYIVYSVNII